MSWTTGRVRRFMGLGVVLLALSGCAALGTANDPFRTQSEQQLIIRVENTGVDDVTIHAMGPGRRVSLGRIQGRSIRQFSIPWSSVQDVRFQIEPLGGRRVTTQAVLVGPGEFIQLVVTQPADRSFIRR